MSDQKSTSTGNFVLCNYVQGSFHQTDILLKENAWTQCVANCLAGLSFYKVKSSQNWTSQDMDRILITGDELYTYLQRSSFINDRFLLGEDLPHLFECFYHSYAFKANDSMKEAVRPKWQQKRRCLITLTVVVIDFYFKTNFKSVSNICIQKLKWQPM